MKEQGILFTGEMVRAILAGTKTVTRRTSSRYEAGQTLWVKETWRPQIGHSHGEDACDCADVFLRYDADRSSRYVREENIPDAWLMPKAASKGNVSPLLMPRWASRITLSCTSVRRERLHEITEEDARREGCDGNCPIGYIPAHSKGPCVYHFRNIWERIHGEAVDWDTNPLVYRIEFKVLRIVPTLASSLPHAH